MEYIGITKSELLSKYPRLYRFVSINDALELFESQLLPLKNPSKWKDPYESFYLSKEYQIKDKLMELPIKDKIFASCFSSESNEASWKIYTPNNDGVRITFNTEKLLHQLKSQNKDVEFYIGKVDYQTTRDYFSLKNETSGIQKEIVNKKIGKHQINLLLKKRVAFEYENEIRIIVISKKNNKIDLPLDLTKCGIEINLHPLIGKLHAKVLKEYFNTKYEIRTTHSALYKEISNRPIVLKK
jgi:hypothetical protein